MRTEKGFTLIEVVMAMAIMSTVMLGMASMTASLLHVVSVGDRKASALQLIDSRIDEIQMDPNYAGLDTTYVGTESNFAELPGVTRATVIVHVGGGSSPVDHKKITVTVQGTGLPQPLSRTVTVGAP